jgi:asparagine synthase (glutamine-hydrolysing)
MCGISGWFDTKATRQADRRIVHAMNAAIAHRGPDGDGFFFAPGVGLGHRRLAIIDLSPGGHQPKASADGRIQIVFNGEIYNFRELRQELEAKGRSFATKSDTEVIIQAWEEWGQQSVSHLIGQFAFALWDAGAQSLHLVRDRLGEKPLYYSLLEDGGLVFGSELKALLAHPDCRRRIDPLAVEDFFALGYVAEPRTIYAGVKKVPAGGIIAFRRGAAPRHFSYWSPSPEASSGSEGARAEELIERLGRAVKMQMVSDVPIGAFLSGGVDSSATTALMAKASPTPIRCFTIGFAEKAFDETEYARKVAKKYGAVHRVKTVSVDDVEAVRSLPHVFDEPFGDSSALPALQLARLAREDVTVALSGDAGDELFAGYRRYRFHAREERLRALLPQAVRGPLFGLLARLYPQMDWAPRALRARHTFQELSLDTAHGFFSNVSVADDAQRAALFSPALKQELQGYTSADLIAQYFNEAPGDDVLARAQYVDLKTWLPGDILTKVDRTSMAASLESRVPMLDPDFADWALGLPADMKIRAGEGKFLLKKALEPLIPADILYRPKQGFSIPLAAWMAGQMGAEFERDLGAPGGLSDCGLFNMATVKQLLVQHRRGLRDHGRILWQLWMFHHFLTDVHAAPAVAEAALETA